jgi:hypothetical protein
MAVTIYDEPQKYSTAGNPLMFTFSSDETAQPNFSFIVEVYVNGSLHSTHQVFRQFNTLSKFDCSGILASTLSSPLIVDGTLTTFYDSAINEYYIIVYEKYGTTPTIQLDQTSSTLYAFNGSLRHPDWIDFDYQNYNADTNNSTSPRLFLTSWPRAKRYYCGLDERVFLGIICDDTGMNLRVRIYNSSNTQIATDLVAVTLSNFIVFDASPSTIIANTSITQGNFDAAAYYTIEARPTGGGAYSGASEAFRIDIDLECHRYDTKRLHWLNKFGVWDSFTFTLVSVDSTNVESYGYQREKGVWDNTSYTYPLYQGERVTFAKRATDQLILNSDWISQEVQQWLVRSLYESPVVYLEQENGTEFEPVNITNSSYQFKTRRRDGLIQEQITIERTYSYTSQLN